MTVKETERARRRANREHRVIERIIWRKKCTHERQSREVRWDKGEEDMCRSFGEKVQISLFYEGLNDVVSAGCGCGLQANQTVSLNHAEIKVSMQIIFTLQNDQV